MQGLSINPFDFFVCDTSVQNLAKFSPGFWTASYSVIYIEHLLQKCDLGLLWCSSEIPSNLLLLDRSPNFGPLISRWEPDKFIKNFWNKSFRSSKILALLYQQFSNLLISQRDMSGPRLGALSNNRGYTSVAYLHVKCLTVTVTTNFLSSYQISGSAIYMSLTSQPRIPLNG